MSTASPQLTLLKEQFENLFEFSPYAIFIHDFKKITNVNHAFLELYGYADKDEIIGEPALESVVFPEDIKMVKKARKERKEGVPFFIPSVRLLKKDGSFFYAEAHASTFVFDGKQHLQISTRDITEAKKAEETLLESERKHRTLFQNSLDGIYKSTPAGRFVDVNPALVKMLGYDSEKELKSIDIKTQLYFKEEDRKIMASNIDDQYPLKRKDGSKIWVEDHAYYEYDDNGDILYHHGILRDVTEKIAEREKLQDLLAVTEDQNQRLQNFAHIISHNIRSHSANMSSLVRFLEESKSGKEKDELFEMLKTSTVKLNETIQNLNEIITVNQNLKKPKELRSLKKEIGNTLKVLSGDIIENEIMLSVDVDPKIKVNVIPAYLDSILLNVISNAIKYRSEDITSTIAIDASKQDEFIVLNIVDNGIGIDLEKHKGKLFRMYETFHSNKDSRGFGLYITKNQIEAMNGKIEVESELGKGSIFKIYFE